MFRFGRAGGTKLAVRTAAMRETTACPFLKEIVMIYCDACPSHKLLPRNQVVSMGPCSSADYGACPLFLEITRAASGRQANPLSGAAGIESEARS
jgi:hypothetical protein